MALRNRVAFSRIAGVTAIVWLLGCSPTALGSRARLTGTEATAADSTLARGWLQRLGEEDKVVDVPPSPIGGMGAILSRVKYPRAAQQRMIEGSVLIGFRVNEAGDVDDIEVLRGIGYGCDEVASEAVRQTKFSPGLLAGKPTPVRMILPVQFRLTP